MLEILDYFASTRAPATLSALSSALELPKSSCLALIATLHASGYLYEVKPGVGYYPTRRWLDRATGITASDPLATKMRPVMLALSEETGETIILGKRAGDRVIYIEVVELALRRCATPPWPDNLSHCTEPRRVKLCSRGWPQQNGTRFSTGTNSFA